MFNFVLDSFMRGIFDFKVKRQDLIAGTVFEVKGKPEWLLIPSQHWAKFEEYRKIKEFADHLPVTNDSAERGIALIKACIEKVTDESEKQDLIQIVANFRTKTTSLNKDVLNNL